MATVTGLTKERMLEIEAESIVGGTVDGTGHLILERFDGSTIDAGYIVDNTALVALVGGQTIAGIKTFLDTIRGTDSDNKFGVGAAGAAGTYVDIGDLGSSTGVYVDARGTPADVDLTLRAKGDSSVSIQDSQGNVRAVPSGVLGYEEVTATQAPLGAGADLTGLSTTVAVPAGHLIRVSFFGNISSSVTDDEVYIDIQEGSTVLGHTYATGLGNRNHSLTRAVILTPSVGAHTYKLRAGVSVGSGLGSLVAAADDPAYILVEDIGS